MLLVGVLYSWLQLCRRLVEFRNSCLGNSRRRTSLSPLFHYDIQRSFGDPSSKIKSFYSLLFIISLEILIYQIYQISYFLYNLFFSDGTYHFFKIFLSFKICMCTYAKHRRKIYFISSISVNILRIFFCKIFQSFENRLLAKLLKILKSHSFEDKYL